MFWIINLDMAFDSAPGLAQADSEASYRGAFTVGDEDHKTMGSNIVSLSARNKIDPYQTHFRFAIYSICVYQHVFSRTFYAGWLLLYRKIFNGNQFLSANLLMFFTLFVEMIDFLRALVRWYHLMQRFSLKTRFTAETQPEKIPSG